jgi:hypothetical protein
MRKLLALGLLVLLCGASLPLQAGTQNFSNLHVIADAGGGPGLFARVRYYCGDALWDGVSATVSRQANTVTVTIPSSAGMVCIGLPPPPEDFDIALGSLEPGDYQLVLQQAPTPPQTLPTPLLSTAFTVSGFAPFENLRALPNPASASAGVAARLLYSCGNGTMTGPQSVVVQGDLVTLRLPVDLEPCFAGLPPPPGDVDFPLGQLPPGHYTVVVLQEVTPNSTVIPALRTALQVQGTAVAQPVPLDARWALIALAGLLALVGAAALPDRRQRRSA